MMKKISIILVMLFWCNVSFAGECIEGDCNNGSGTYTSQAGDRYVGEFKNGKFHGQGTAIWVNGNKYVGEFKNGPVTGQGTMTYTDGSKYVGEFKNGERHGQGTYSYPHGSVVVGIFKKDELVEVISEDTSAWKKAECIEGDCQNGFGTKTYPNGKKYVGEFKNGEMHGQGTLNDSMGTKYVGGWKKGKHHGIQTITFSSGQISVIKFKNGAVKKVISKDTSAVDKAKKKMELASMVDDAKKTCKDLGFTEGTDKFSDCSLKLYSQSVELAAKSKQQIAGASLGGSVTIYDPVRDSRALMKQGQRMLSGACTFGVNC